MFPYFFKGICSAGADWPMLFVSNFLTRGISIIFEITVVMIKYPHYV